MAGRSGGSDRWDPEMAPATGACIGVLVGALIWLALSLATLLILWLIH